MAGRLFMGIIALALWFAVIERVVDPVFSCKPLPPLGPRLLNAKAAFGEFMRKCHKEIIDYMKTVPPHMVRRIVPLACIEFRKCFPLMADQNYKPFLDCVLPINTNMSSVLYTKLNLTEKYAFTAKAGLECLVKVASELPYGVQAMDDAMTFGMRTIMTFGAT
ncbi:uncharacterized protein LOC142769202 [Rhipicephalus microplus]|uniref:uncharacterized protein LOC142769202 n=1 Tax=Rhipicephalus microplus TaxID=6941 RepID=UPI003F6CE9BE